MADHRQEQQGDQQAGRRDDKQGGVAELVDDQPEQWRRSDCRQGGHEVIQSGSGSDARFASGRYDERIRINIDARPEDAAEGKQRAERSHGSDERNGSEHEKQAGDARQDDLLLPVPVAEPAARDGKQDEEQRKEGQGEGSGALLQPHMMLAVK
ncbi:hypothetical protein BGX30_009126, partial [Mortierella sp. GBA39]